MNHSIIKNLINWKLLLLIIILLGFVLRFYQLGQVPNGFYADEAAFGYNAYSLLHTGKDEYGKFLPVVLKSFGDYKGAFYSYAVIPFISVFGLTPFAVRFPSVLFDTFTIFVIFLFVEDFLKNRKLALISSFLYAISPWSINISRTTGDVISAVFFSVLMAYGLGRLSRSFEKRWLLLTLAASFFAIISYAPFRFFVVIIALIFFLASINNIKSKIFFDKIFLYIILAVLALGIIYSFLASVTRFNQISIFSTPQTQLILNEQIREDQFTPVIITRLFHNKFINYARTVLYNAQQYFTLDFLALNGGYPKRERVPDSGLFYLWEMPFLLAGIYFIIRNKRKNELFFILWWFLLLLPTFVTFDEIPNVHRSIIILPAICVITAMGIYNVFSFKRLRKLKFFSVLILVLAIFIVYELLYFYHQYLVHFDVHQPWYRGYAYKQLVVDLEKYYPKFNKIIVTKSQSSPYIYILFYSKYSPRKYQVEGSRRDLDYTGFGKYLFVPLVCPLNGGKSGNNKVVGKPGILYVDSGICTIPVNNAKVLDVVRWGDGSIAFKLMEFVATGSSEFNKEYQKYE